MPAGNLSVYLGTLAYGTGKFGQARTAAVLSGICDDFLGTPGTQSTLGTGTIEFWFKVPTVSALKVIAGHIGWWWVGHDATGNLTASLGAVSSDGGTGATPLTTTQQVDDNTWWHVALVFDSGVASLYAGQSGTGSRLATSGSAIVSGTVNGDGSMSVGGFDDPNPVQRPFDFAGAVDEIRVSTTARYTGATYTVPATTFGDDASTYGVWSLDGDLNEGATPTTTTTTTAATTTTTTTAATTTTTTTAATTTTTTTAGGGTTTTTTTAATTYHWRFAHEPLVWNGTAYPARPPGAKSVTWIGPSQPAGWLANDVWVNNS